MTYEDTNSPEQQAEQPVRGGGRGCARRSLSLLLGLAALAAAGALSAHWLANRPRAVRRPPSVEAPLVTTMPVELSTQHVSVSAMGTVVASQTVELAPRVSGPIVSVSPSLLPGGFLNAGERVVEIDKDDYVLAVETASLVLQQAALAVEQSDLMIAQRESNVAQAEMNLKLEEGQQDIARREYELFESAVTEGDEELVLRRPQLRASEAALAAAQAQVAEAKSARESAVAAKAEAEKALREAQLDLERTDVHAPFNAIVQSKSVGLGSHVSQGTFMATLVDTNEYWVQASVPVDRLKWIRIPGSEGPAGSAARVFYRAAWGDGVFRAGSVKRLMTDLDPEGRMARLLIEVRDPLSLSEAGRGQPRLILGAYVQVEIEGEKLTDVAVVPRSALRDQSRVWLLARDGTLRIRPVEIAAGTAEEVYVVSGLVDGDLLITSALATPVEGMALRTENGFRAERAQPEAAGAKGAYRMGA